jgi:hypothetical protein
MKVLGLAGMLAFTSFVASIARAQAGAKPMTAGDLKDRIREIGNPRFGVGVTVAHDSDQAEAWDDMGQLLHDVTEDGQQVPDHPEQRLLEVSEYQSAVQDGPAFSVRGTIPMPSADPDESDMEVVDERLDPQTEAFAHRHYSGSGARFDQLAEDEEERNLYAEKYSAISGTAFPVVTESKARRVVVRRISTRQNPPVVPTPVSVPVPVSEPKVETWRGFEFSVEDADYQHRSAVPATKSREYRCRKLADKIRSQTEILRDIRVVHDAIVRQATEAYILDIVSEDVLAAIIDEPPSRKELQAEDRLWRLKKRLKAIYPKFFDPSLHFSFARDSDAEEFEGDGAEDQQALESMSVPLVCQLPTGEKHATRRYRYEHTVARRRGIAPEGDWYAKFRKSPRLPADQRHRQHGRAEQQQFLAELQSPTPSSEDWKYQYLNWWRLTASKEVRHPHAFRHETLQCAFCQQALPAGREFLEALECTMSPGDIVTVGTGIGHRVAAVA